MTFHLLGFQLSPQCTLSHRHSSLESMAVSPLSNITHSGYQGLIDLVTTTTSRLSLSLPSYLLLVDTTSSVERSDMRRMSRDLGKAKDREIQTTGVRYEQTKARPNVDPSNVRATGRQAGQPNDDLRRRGGRQQGKHGVKV